MNLGGEKARKKIIPFIEKKAPYQHTLNIQWVISNIIDILFIIYFNIKQNLKLKNLKNMCRYSNNHILYIRYLNEE